MPREEVRRIARKDGEASHGEGRRRGESRGRSSNRSDRGR
jgi:hypothetical protein